MNLEKLSTVILLFLAAVGLTGFTAAQSVSNPTVKFDKTIYLDGSVDGDVILFANEVTVNATISGDLIVFAAQADIQGSVRDNLRVVAGQLNLNAAVGDDVSLAAWQINQTLKPKKFMPHFQPTFKTITGLILLEKLASLTIEILIGWLLILLLPQLAKQLVSLGLKQPGAAIGWGLLFLTVIPLLACLFIITLIGIPLGVVTILIYVVSLSLAKLLAALSLGSRLLKDAKLQKPYLSLVLGLIIMVILQLIPIFGWLAYFILILFGLGLLTLQEKTLLTRLKK